MAITLQLRVSGVDQFGAPIVVPGTPVWSSSNPLVASVDQSGLVTRGTVPGVAAITATLGGYTSNVATITVPVQGSLTSFSMSLIAEQTESDHVSARAAALEAMKSVASLASSTYNQLESRLSQRVEVISSKPGTYLLKERIDVDLSLISAADKAAVIDFLKERNYIVET